jgi:cytochrome P450
MQHETLRFYTPVPHISRSTAKNSPQQLTTSTKIHHVPGNTTIYINVQGMHRDEKIWGPDARTFRPTRWLGKGSTLDKPLPFTPPRGTFLPWSAGPRACPGMKMAQVEFVAVMFAVFRRARVSPVVRGSETKKMAAERLKMLMQDSQPRITLQMNKPKEVVLRWEMR